MVSRRARKTRDHEPAERLAPPQHRHAGGRSLDQKSVLVCDMVDERIDRVDQYYDDTTYNDEFWA